MLTDKVSLYVGFALLFSYVRLRQSQILVSLYIYPIFWLVIRKPCPPNSITCAADCSNTPLERLMLADPTHCSVSYLLDFDSEFLNQTDGFDFDRILSSLHSFSSSSGPGT